ncbi:MAG: helix-turn-helix transcriptional regulator [Sedimentisphaerales bacterium]|nr:helix-turn-helix transcriptional regulator [Sedimentisphaerales bacterium]
MLRYVKTQSRRTDCQLLAIQEQGQTFYPSLHHTAIHQDAPVGDRKTFCEHVHDLYHLVLYTRHQGGYSRCGKIISTIPGTLALVWPGQPHDFITCRKTAVYSEITFAYESPSGKSLSIPFDQLLSLYSGLPVLLGDLLQLSEDKTNHLNSLLIQLTDFANSPSDYSFYLRQKTLGRIFDFLIESSQQQKSVSETQDYRIHQAKCYIESHYTESLSIESLAKSAGMSKGYFFRQFKQTFQISPSMYHQQLRMEAAKTLLRCSHLQGKEIAARCGYENPFFFCRVFKKYTGMTPLTFRKKSIQLPFQSTEQLR